MATGGTVGSRSAVTQDWRSTARSCPAAVYRFGSLSARDSRGRAGLHVDVDVDSDGRRRCESMERTGESLGSRWTCDRSSRVYIRFILMIHEDDAGGDLCDLDSCREPCCTTALSEIQLVVNRKGCALHLQTSHPGRCRTCRLAPMNTKAFLRHGRTDLLVGVLIDLVDHSIYILQYPSRLPSYRSSYTLPGPQIPIPPTPRP